MASASQAERSTLGWFPIAWALVALLVGGALCFVPLFDLLGYEAALALTPFAAACGIHLGLRAVESARQAAAGALRERAQARPLLTLLSLAASAAARALVVLLVPLALLSLNALRVRNCNAGVGLAWYLVLPCLSAPIGAALGVALAVVAPRASSRRLALPAALAILLGALAWCALRLYTAPPIFVFDPLLGYFAGSLYDEHVGLPAALGWARAYHAAIALGAVSVAALFLDGERLAARAGSARGRLGLLAIAAGTLGAALAGYALGPRFGYRHDARTIANALGGERATEHFVLHYREAGPYAAELDDVADELELRYAELARALGLQPSLRVHAYLFSSAADKQALMGAGRTYIAKPWRREIYVNHEAFPQEVLGHELAHVFGAEVGDALLGLPRAGLRLDVGLTEGFAEALTWRGGALTLDESVRVLDALGKMPPLGAVMSPRFWSLPSQQAYAVAGSFVHHLLERYGAARLASLYRQGGTASAYRAVYGQDLPGLGAAWLGELRRIELAPGVLERERARLLRPSIFRRPCAHELARLVEQARAASARGDHAAARAYYEQACSEEPDDPGHLDELLVESARSHDLPRVRAVAARLLAHPKASAGQRAAVHATLGDLEAEGRFYAEAAASYRRAEAEPLDEGSARLVTVKRALAERLAGEPPAAAREASASVLHVLVEPSADAAADGMRIVVASREAPEDRLLAYLAARQLYTRKLYAEAEHALDEALLGPLPDERFVREALRLRAESAFRRRDYAEAERRFTALGHRDGAGARVDAARWARRARWFAEHRP